MDNPRRRYCVFCGASSGAREAYVASAREIGRELAARNIELVYGGGNVGLMGVLADAVLEGGGHVIGVIPQALLKWEVAHDGLPDLRVVASMHERKALMADLSDGFIALPGGIGTLEEFFEVVSWGQLGLHRKPCGVINVAGFFDPLRAMLAQFAAERFLRPEHEAMIIIESDAVRLLAQFEEYCPPQVPKLIDRSQT